MWAFLGDGEMAEPESLGAIGVAAREELDNLTWVINCNLQQLDGPVRGNGKIIQELEAQFRGAGWNVIKVIWGREWDALLARDVDGVLVNQMNSTPDGAVPDLLGRGRRLQPRALLRRRPAPAQDGRAHDRPADREAAARRPRLPQGVRRLRRCGQARRPADRDPGAHRQGLDDRGPRGPQRHPPDEEAQDRRLQEVPRPALPADERQGHRRRLRGERRRAVLPPRTRLPRDRVHDGAAQAARRAAPQARRPRQAREGSRRRSSTTSSSRARGRARSPPRWRSCGCSATG